MTHTIHKKPSVTSSAFMSNSVCQKGSKAFDKSVSVYYYVGNCEFHNSCSSYSIVSETNCPERVYDSGGGNCHI